jgi:hypothetical protein
MENGFPLLQTLQFVSGYRLLIYWYVYFTKKSVKSHIKYNSQRPNFINVSLFDKSKTLEKSPFDLFSIPVMIPILNSHQQNFVNQRKQKSCAPQAALRSRFSLGKHIIPSTLGDSAMAGRSHQIKCSRFPKLYLET